jgi:hypothetical protein
VLVVVAWPFELSEGKRGSIAVPVSNTPVDNDRMIASGGDETEVNGTSATGFFDLMSFWEEGGGGGPDCSSATAAARFGGHRELLT